MLELDALLRRMQEGWSWPQRAHSYVVVNRWQSRTAMLYRCRGEGGEPDVVLKVVQNSSDDEARGEAEAMERVDHVLATSGRTAVRVVPVLGWDDTPPSVCTRHIEGTDIFFMFKNLDHPAWGQTQWSYEDVVTECGRALGAYHAAEDPASSQSPTAAGAAETGFIAAARAVRLSERLAKQMEARVAIAPRYGDFGPHQFRLSERGDLYLLDTPVMGLPAPVHGDIAAFVFGLEKILGDATRGGRRRRRRLMPGLREAFYAGYAGAGPIDPGTPENRSVIGFYFGRAALGITRKRLRQGRLLAALRHGAQWGGQVVAARRLRPRFRG